MFDKVGKIQMGLAGVGIGALATFLVVSNVWWKRGYDAAELKAMAVISKLKGDVAGAESDISQCQTVVSGYHQSVAAQLAENNRILSQNTATILDAAKRNTEAEKVMLNGARMSAANLDAARKAISDALDKCVRANVPSDLVGLLNAGIAPTPSAPNASSAGRAGGDR